MDPLWIRCYSVPRRSARKSGAVPAADALGADFQKNLWHARHPGPLKILQEEIIVNRNFAALALLAAGWIAAAPAHAQDLSPADKERAMQYLETTKKNIVEATKGLSEAQWNFKPAPERWSAAETMEHIAAAEDFIRGMTVEKAMKGPAEAGRDLKKNDEAVMSMIPNRSHKAQAPEPLKPVNRFGSPENSLKHFLESRAQTEDFLEHTPDLRQHVADSPLGIKLDAYEWVLFLTAHSERAASETDSGSQSRSELSEVLRNAPGARLSPRTLYSPEAGGGGGVAAGNAGNVTLLSRRTSMPVSAGISTLRPLRATM